MQGFFFLSPADLGHSFASCMEQGSCLAGSLQGQSHCPLMPSTSSPISGRAAEHSRVSPCCHAHEDEEGWGEHSLPGSSPSPFLGAWPSSSCWFEEANKSHMGRKRARTLREDSPSPWVLFIEERDATSGCVPKTWRKLSFMFSFCFPDETSTKTCSLVVSASYVWREWSQLVSIVTIE